MSKSCKDIRSTSAANRTYVIIGAGRDLSLIMNVNGRRLDMETAECHPDTKSDAHSDTPSSEDQSSENQGSETLEVNAGNESIHQLSEIQLVNKSDDESEVAIQPSTVDQICNIAESTAKEAIQIAKVYNINPEEEDDLSNTTDSNVETDGFISLEEEEDEDTDNEEEDSHIISSVVSTSQMDDVNALRTEVFDRIETLQTDITDIKAMLSQLVQKYQ